MEPHQLNRQGLWVHLRLPFSVLLMPVYWFALWCIPAQHLQEREANIVFVLLHVLIYPASNGFNSMQDQDEGPIGLLQHPPLPSPWLRPLTIAMDVLALALAAWYLSFPAWAGLGLYILASRLYSWRPVRIKRYAVPGFLLVFLCQGALVFWIVQAGCNAHWISTWKELAWSGLLYRMQDATFLLPAGISSLFIGSMYPLTQIYQHAQDRRDGVHTLSARLGLHGTFIFSGALFSAAMLLLWPVLEQVHSRAVFFLCLMPVPLYFLYWWNRVRQDERHADFLHTMRMSLLSSLCLNLAFILLLLFCRR